MKQLFVILILFAGLFLMTAEAQSFSDQDILLSSPTVVRGGLIFITVKADAAEKPRVTWMKKDVPLVYSAAGASWHGFLAADLTRKPGVYQAIVQSPDGFEKNLFVPVMDENYGVRKLKLPVRTVELDNKTLQRVRKEYAVVNALWQKDCLMPAWNDPFVPPADGEITGNFGQRTIINNRKRAPHTGMDIRGDTGDPVRAIHSGTVVLVADHFFTGRSIFLDHGGCIISMYFHLDEILVKQGDVVEKGQVIGLLGETGRATGPHLHFGVRVNGARINPLTLIDLSKNLSKPD